MEIYVVLLFILLMLAEAALAIYGRDKRYNLKEMLENVGIGLFSGAIDYGFSLLSYPLLKSIFERWAFIQWERNFLYYLLLFILLDLLEYWFHRLSHEVPAMWAAHKVHHQSKGFDLTVGLRTSFLIPVFNIGFYCMLPLLGFAPEDILLFIFLQGSYQLFIHTRLIDKLGVFDRIVVTPSVHRVHHGTNAIYLDKNYGKVLALWDHLFGTYQKETEEVVYGASDPEGEQGIIRAQILPLKKWWKKKRRKEF